MRGKSNQTASDSVRLNTCNTYSALRSPLSPYAMSRKYNFYLSLFIYCSGQHTVMNHNMLWAAQEKAPSSHHQKNLHVRVSLLSAVSVKNNCSIQILSYPTICTTNYCCTADRHIELCTYIIFTALQRD